jgi:two-component system nitrate/nitrite response regulator NarL
MDSQGSTGSAPRVRILIADDHPIFRDGLRRLLESEPGFQVVGEAQDGADAVALATALEPDILLLDMAMPRVTGMGALQQLMDQASGVRSILMTAAIEKAERVSAIQQGARGIVLKEVATQLLFKSIRCVLNGQYWVDREGVADLVDTLRAMLASTESKSKKQLFGLTKREFEVVGAIVGGFANKDIAQKFSISEDTVKHHLTNIFNKVGVSNRLELALFAVHHKIVDQV